MSEPEKEKKRGERGKDERERKRRRGKIEGSSSQADVDRCLQDGGSLEEACGILRDNEGFSVSTNAMSRYARRLRANSEQLQKLEMLVAEIVDRAETPIGRDAGALARRLLLARALDAVDQLPDDSLEGLSAERLSQFVSRLERTAAMVERVRLARTRAYDRAWEDILDRIEIEMENHPDLRLKLRKIAEEMYEAAEREAGAYPEEAPEEGEEEGKEGEG